ncbi:hypothetical protein COV11_02155 [Candidatus Woesearchaeota archaeon CG10_big_fil_rev_8_21_14_0_10_30_7]|nr:MAG: hypothetical protein COV11_02155 [Candidatus Woesearchaeota archaeon CG10_big_fil_rev_8_21_14_0_10_30_7]
MTKYDFFPGKNVEQMQLLLKKGFEPLSMYDLVVKRLNVLGTYEEDLWWNTDFDTINGCVYYLDFSFKIVHDADFLKKMNKKTNLLNGSVILNNDLEGKVFIREEHIFNRNLSFEEAKVHECWIDFLRGNTKVLSDYVDAVWTKTDTGQVINNNMGIFLAPPEELLTGCAWHLSSINKHSDVGGDFYLNYENGLLVGKK